MASRKAEIARELRRRSSYPERIVWNVLRGRAFSALKFRRQHPIGPFVVDFVCLDRRFILEVDGPHHQHPKEKDGRRDEWLKSEGYFVLRLNNEDFLVNENRLIEKLLKAIKSFSPNPITSFPMRSPSPLGGEGRGEGSAEEILNSTPHPALSPKGRGTWYARKNFRSVLIFLSAPIFLSHLRAAPAPLLPPWVDKVVGRRVNDLLAEARRYEGECDYAMAIDRSLEAVRLAPTNPAARATLLRTNEKGLKAAERDFEKKRKTWVREATDRYRAETAWRDAMQGKIAEAERFADKGRYAEACDRYYQILEESPSYLPALKGLERLQVALTKELDHGGHFPSDDARRVAQGFWFYNQRQWQEAADIWNGILSDAAAAKKWGSVRLGAYAARAVQNHEADLRTKRIDEGLAEGLAKFRDGRLADAQQSFQSVLQIDPANPQAQEYARLIPGLKERVRADVLTEVKDQQIANTLSEAVEFYLKGYYDEAEAKVDAVLKESPDHPQALSIANDIRKARGVPAIPTLEERVTAEQLQIDALYSDGIIAFAEGRLADAKVAWENVLKKQPTHPRAAQALRKLSEETSNEDPK